MPGPKSGQPLIWPKPDASKITVKTSGDTMPRRRLNLIVPILTIIVALPALLSLAYYRFTGDPTLRPLGVTIESLTEAATPGYTSGITVEILWGRNATSPSSRAQISRALEKALSIYPVDYRVRIREKDGDRIEVYFKTGSSSIGPYSLANVAAGIPPVLEAYNLSNRSTP
jgi:hypothetical protein